MYAVDSCVRYRYGFQGQEMDNEVKGEGNSYTAQFWQYDPRVARRWNVDPVVKQHESPYAAFANNPIWFVDPSGADSAKVSGSNTWSWDTEKGDTYTNISSRTGVSVEDLQKWNPSYKDTKIPVGANLNISDPNMAAQKGPLTATIGDGVITILNYQPYGQTLDVALTFVPNVENSKEQYMWFQTVETNDPKQHDGLGKALELLPGRSLSELILFDDKQAGYNLYHSYGVENDKAFNAIPQAYRSKFNNYPADITFPTGLHIATGKTMGFKDGPSRPVINAGEIIWKATLVLRKRVEGNWVDVQSINYGFTQPANEAQPISTPLILSNPNNH